MIDKLFGHRPTESAARAGDDRYSFLFFLHGITHFYTLPRLSSFAGPLESVHDPAPVDIERLSGHPRTQV